MMKNLWITPYFNYRFYPSKCMMFAFFALLMMVMLAEPVKADGKQDAEEIVMKAGYSLTKIWQNDQTGASLQKYFSQAVGIIIVPQSLAGGFIIGGEGGTGVLLARGINGWSYPAFITASSASIGLQFGAQYSESVYLIMTPSALNAVLNDLVKIGGNIKGAVGPVGAGLDASSSTDMNLDILAWSVSQGAYLGASIAGTAFVPREQMNRVYYNATLKPSDIVISGQASNPQADSLRLLLQDFSSKAP